jgi:Cu+-exporting ATPase
MGAPFYSGAFKSVRHGAANMDVLVVLGTTAAWLYGVILIFMRFGK